MRFLVTAGPTREAIDPVRFLSNRSSGKMGYAITEAILGAGHDCLLVTGPTCLDPPSRAEIVAVESADEMYEAVADRLAEVDIAIFVAAVADYRPREVSAQKLKKQSGDLVLHLERTRDILGSARRLMGFEGILVGFAAETENLEANAKSKLARKGCDLLVANDVSQPGLGFQSDRNEIVLFYAGGVREAVTEQEKTALGEILVARCLELAEASE